MRLAAEDFKRLRGTFAACGGLLLITAVLLQFSWSRARDYDKEAERSRLAQAEMSRQLAGLRGEAARLAGHRDAYDALVALGGVGAFQKTREIDRFESTVRGLAASGRPAVSRYALRARAPVPGGAPPGLDRLGVSMQQLVFEAELPHEESFLRVWRGIATGLGGLSSIEACELKLGEAGGRQDGVDGEGGQKVRKGWPPLKASCTVAWYAFEPKDAGTVPGGAPVGSVMPAMQAIGERSGS
jgi:hypothetical protein